uniref:TWiK family of potassium channels protein 7 n=1 Tax=Timema monikensis TaxID=170555 RepID=A0A7R9DY92_9NEOP|nr:unnamed protein product [Timema monikensis]
MSRQPTEYVEEGRPSRCSLVLYYTWKLCTCLFSHVALVSLVVAYCLLGAITFHNLESENELKVKKNISKIRHNVTEELWRLFQEAPVLILVNWTDTVKERLQLFETDLLRSMKSDGWDGSEAEKVEQWTFSGALFYSIIVITTIAVELNTTSALANYATEAGVCNKKGKSGKSGGEVRNR